MVPSGRRVVSRRLGVLAFLALALWSCGGDDGGTAPDPAITIALSAGSVTITQGQVGSVTVTLQRLNGFAEAVVVTVDGLPTGVTAPALSLAAGQTTGALTFAVAATAQVATTALTVRAVGPGVSDVTSALSLVVQAAPVTGSFTISVSPNSAAVLQGATATAGTVTITRTGGFTGAVNFSAASLPTGVTASFNPATVPGNQTTSTLSFTATAAAATGATGITIIGTATGVAQQTTTLTLTVTPVGPAAGFTLALAPATLTIQQGGTTTSTVTVTRTGTFTGAVNLAVSGLPSGVTASFNPPGVSGGSSILTLSASATATTGPATFTITGSGTGVSNVTVSVSLTVNLSSGGTGNVSIAFCPSVGVPIWVAFQDGPEAQWVRSTPVNGVYFGDILSGRGSIAYVTPATGGGFQTNIFNATTAELQSFGQAFCFGATGTGKTVNVTVAGAAPTDYAFLALGTSATASVAGTTNPFNNVPDGSIDLVAARGVVGTAPTLNRLFVQRGINPAAGSSVAVDFNGSNALNPVNATVQINNLGADQGTVSMLYRTANRTQLAYSFDAPGTSTSRVFGGFPTFAGSFHGLLVAALPNVSTPDRIRSMTLIHSAVANRVVTLGSELGAVIVGATATSPSLRLHAIIPPSQYSSSWSVAFTQGSGAQTRVSSIQSTAGYFVTTPTSVTLAMPDFAGAAGYEATWALANVTTNWFASAQSVSGFGSQGQWLDGAMITSAGRFGTFSTEHEQ